MSSFENFSVSTKEICASFYLTDFDLLTPIMMSDKIISSCVIEGVRQVSESAVGRKKPKPPSDVAMTVISSVS